MDLRTKVLSALRWTIGARFAGQLLTWVITIFVIRMLEPADYGLMAMAMVLITCMILLNTIGLDAVLVQKQDLTEDDRAHVFGVVIISNLTLFVGFQLGAPLIASFYGEPRLVPVIQVLALQFPMLIFETLPQAKLERDLDFKQRSIVEFVTMMAGSALTFSMAISGYGVWALVGGSLATTATRMLGLNLISRCLCVPRFTISGMARNLPFGGFVAMDRGLWFVFAETDKLIGGRLLGKDLLGYYTVAAHLASLPIQKLAGLINSVAFPAFSKVGSTSDKMDWYLLKAVRVTSVLAFPTFLGMSVVAPELVAILLGDKWSAAALPMQVLALVMPIRALANLLPPLLWGVGRPDVSATNFLIAAICMPVAFYIGAQYGVIGLALAWVIGYPLVALISIFRACRVIGVGLGEFLGAMVGPAVASAVMYGCVMLTKSGFIVVPGQLLELGQLIIVGALAYMAVMYLLFREGLMETLELLRG